MRFDLAEVPALLGDPSVAKCSRAAVESIFVGSAQPLAIAVDGEAYAVRTAAFASSMQGLCCRLARLPDLAILPEPLSSHVLAEAGRTEARGRRILERLHDVLGMLASAGAEAIPLKGAALILRGDVEASQRPMGDIDLLVVDESRLESAVEVLERRTAYRRVFSTPRHLVFAEEREAVPCPAGEHSDNPLRIELHRSFRLPVLGTHLDSTKELRRTAQRRSDGALVPPPAMMFRHLWHHAAEDFAARGLRGIQAIDFLDMARRDEPIRAMIDPDDAGGAAPLLYAADGIERLFPGTFDPASLEEIGRRVPARLRERASRLSVLRHTRLTRGWTKASLMLAPGRIAQCRYLLRTAFPTPGEVRANVAPDASGVRLAFVWMNVLARRARQLLP